MREPVRNEGPEPPPDYSSEKGVRPDIASGHRQAETRPRHGTAAGITIPSSRKPPRHRRQRTWAVHGDVSAHFHGTKRRQAVRRAAAGDGLHMSRRCRRQLRAGSAKRKSCRRIVRKTGRQDRYGRQTMQADTIRRARRYFRSGPVASPSPKRSVRRTDGRLIRQKRPEDRFEAVFGASWLWECYSSAEPGSATRMRPQYSQIITFLP